MKQESYFWWRSPLAHYGYPDWSLSDGELGHGSESFSAFTVAELGKLLPSYIESKFLEDPDKWQKIEKDENADGSVRWNVSYQDDMGKDLFEVSDSSESDARAKMLIYLLENKIITL